MKTTHPLFPWLGALVFAAALLVRLAYLADSADQPAFHAPIIDGATYDALARQPLTPRGQLQDIFFWQSPFYPFFLTVVYRLTHGSMLAARLVQAVIGALTCLLTYRLAARLFSPRAGLVAGGITAGYSLLFFYDVELMGTGLSVFWMMALLNLLLDARDRPDPAALALLGATGACGLLTHPTLLFPFAAGCVWWAFRAARARGFRVLGRGAAGLALGFGLIALPAAWLNRQVTGKFALMPASGGLNFFIGNTDYCPHVTPRPGCAWERLRGLPQEEGRRGMWEESAFFYRRGLEFIRRHPAQTAARMTSKGLQLASSRELPNTYDEYVFRRWSVLLRALLWRAGGFGFPFGALLPLALLGAWFRRREVPGFLPAGLLLFAAGLLTAHVSGRYRLPLVPPLAVLAAGGCGAIGAAWRARATARLLGMLLLAAGVVLLGTLPGPFAQERLNYPAELQYGVGAYLKNQGQLPEARAAYAEAVRLNPDYSDALTNLGEVELLLGDTSAAAAHFQAALRADPANHKACYNLGYLHQRQGRLDEAAAWYRRALETWPLFADACNNLGVVLKLQGRTAEATAAFRRALQLQPDLVDTHSNLGVLLFAAGDTEAGLRELAEAFRLAPDNPAVRDNYRRALQRAGRP